MTRGFLAIVLVVVATVTGFIALGANWAERQALDTERWVSTSSELLADEAIRDEIARQLAEEIPASSEEEINAQLDSAAVDELWAEANDQIHTLLVAVVEESAAAGELGIDPSAELDLDLTAIRDRIGGELGVDLSGASDPATLEIFTADELDTIRGADDLLSATAIASLVITIALYLLALVIAAGRRRMVLAAVAVSLLVIGAGTLTLRGASAAGGAEELGGSEQSQEAIEQTLLIGTGQLADICVWLIVIGSLILAGLIVIAMLERKRERERVATHY